MSDRDPPSPQNDHREGGRSDTGRASHLTELVALIARSLVDKPAEVMVREAKSDRFPRIELTVAKDDIGKVIGKDGRTAQSIRTLLSAAAAKAGVRAYLEILD